MNRIAFHIDLETTGTDVKTDEILQVGLVQVAFDGRLWQPGLELEILIPTGREPTTDFDREHLVDLYARCHKAPVVAPADVRNQILNFFTMGGLKVGARADMMGWNLAAFDLLLMVRESYLEAPVKRYFPALGRSEERGDYSHRIYDIQSAAQLAMDLLGLSRQELFDRAYAAVDYPAKDRVAKVHDAVADCHRKTWLLNGIMELLRQHGTIQPRG